MHWTTKFVRDNGLSLTLFALFFIFLAGLAATGHRHENQELAGHNQPGISLGAYLISGEFGEAVFENWESEFLQMGALVILTIWLRQKGSADSKHITGREAVDRGPRWRLRHAQSWRHRGRAVREMLYANSLSIALFGLFAASLTLHAVTGVAAANQEHIEHHEPLMGVWQYTASAQFWFESFQNWQSEFLAVGALLVLSVFLRQRHSPESKPVAEPNERTGSSS
jgi:hypothetical protein